MNCLVKTQWMLVLASRESVVCSRGDIDAVMPQMACEVYVFLFRIIEKGNGGVKWGFIWRLLALLSLLITP